MEPLYFWLADMELRLPPLRERAGDLYVLVTHFLRQLSPPGRPAPNLTPDAWRVLHDHPFPGNVRELSRALEHAINAAEGGTIAAEHLPETLQARPGRRA